MSYAYASKWAYNRPAINDRWKVVDSNRHEVMTGDIIIDFRGESSVYRSITRAPEIGKSGKILSNPIAHPTWGNENYPQVFDLKIVAR